MTELHIGKTKFEQWVHWAQSNPENFEQMREHTLEMCINQANKENQQRLRCLQWRIDHIRKQSTPLKACETISQLMWNAFEDMRNALVTGPEYKSAVLQNNAKVLPFPRPLKP